MTAVPDEVNELHARLTGRLRKQFPMVDSEDVKQELWLAYYGSEYALNGSQEPVEASGEPGEGSPTSEAFHGLKKEMRNAGERYCRHEKAAAVGYKPRDEAFYELRALAGLLEQWFATGPAEAPPRTRETSVSRPSNPHERGNYLVSLIDIGSAVTQLRDAEKEILFYAYSPEYAGRTDEEIAAELRSTGWKGMTEDAFRGKVRRALVRLQRRLGGASPYKR